ncbi:MAG: DUF3131 domain-containing protein [Candidatus Omnitrophica bacterium]|nr:DUF3131 domain-containing protein [Candidatus Omnitrophota bacterium]
MKRKKRMVRPYGRAILFFVMIVTCLPRVLFAQASEEADFYDSIPKETSLHTAPQFVVVDDFSGGKLSQDKNERWLVKPLRGTKAHLSTLRRDSRNPKRGHSLQLSMKIPPNETLELEKSLNHLDISQATHFAFQSKVRTKKNIFPAGKILVSFTDRSLKHVEHEVTTQMERKQDNWSTVIIPMSFFKELDLDQLLSFSLCIRSGQYPIEGSIGIDEAAFFGEGDLNFESSRDNVVGFPKTVFNSIQRDKLRKIQSDQRLLLAIAKDTWKFFENASDKKTQLVVDNIKIGEQPLVSGYTSPTNIAMSLLGIVAAMDLGLISPQKALHRTRAIISTIAQMKKHKGFLFNFYETKNLMVTRPYISSVDNGWLGIAFVVVRETFRKELWQPVTQMLEQMNFNEFLDTENNQLVIGYDVPQKSFGGNHYGMLVSEARATSLLAIGKGDIGKEHWWYLYRTPPAAWRWQNQIPKGSYKNQDAVEYYQGYYEKDGVKFVPSWGGSLFEYLMPTLVLDEKILAPKSLGKNDRIVTELHRDYALKEKGYPIWGISPAAVANGKSWKYEEFGIKALSVKGYPDRGVVTPHVSFLALDSLPKDAMANIRKYLDYDIYGEYGYFDTLNLQTGKANTQYLALDQGMILVAICNYLKRGSIQKRFHQDPVGKNIEKVLAKESFFKE